MRSIDQTLRFSANRNLPTRQPQALPQNHRAPLLYRLQESPDAMPASESARPPRLALVEALLFIADEPLAPRKLAKAAGLKDVAEARQLIEQLRESYDRDGSSFQVEEIAGGFQLLTRTEYHRWLARLQSAKDVKLSGAARETLAIVAWRQPIMRADVEDIRGVQCGEMLRQLMEKGMVRIAGRDKSLGRPVLYGTTKKFLEVFGLRSLKDLPKIDALEEP